MKAATSWGTLCALAALVVAGCEERDDDGHEHGGAAVEPWAVTAWGDRYEIFAEAAPLEVGVVSKSHTHVTVLQGFAPLRSGVVSAILRGADGTESVFTEREPVRDGIFSIEIRPENEGEYDLVFRVESDAGPEDVPAGRVAVGRAGAPGGLVAPPPSPAPAPAAEPDAARSGEVVSFLKEQQWRIMFATNWTRSGTLQRSVRGPARVRPAAGGEAVLTAPLDGVVATSATLHVGREVKAGAPVVQLTPRPTSGRSFAEMDSELRLAETRLERLRELWEVEAVSAAEMERASALVATLEAERNAVAGHGTLIAVRTPLDGTIADVLVEPGEAVEAGASLARIVKPRPIWIEVALQPDDAAALSNEFAGLVVHGGAGNTPVVLTAEEARLVSRSPEVDRETGALLALFEVRKDTPLQLGTSVDAEVLLPEERPGIVVPASAIVDDAGVPIVYVQVEGESFLRVEARVDARQGDLALVQGVRAGERVVTVGGAAIRRASQLSSGPVEGHVH